MGITYKISLPLYVQISSKARFYLNLNKYRNAHFHVLNTAKKVYTHMATELLIKAGVPFNNSRIELEYIYYNGTKAKSDIGNICPVHDKFFSDTLVEGGFIEDDNYDHIKDIKFTYGGYCKENPRVEVIVTILDGSELSTPIKQSVSYTKEKQMKFNIDKNTVYEVMQDYLNEAMAAYVGSLVTVKEGVEVEVEQLADGSVDVKLVPTKTKAKPKQKPKTPEPEPEKQAEVTESSEAAPEPDLKEEDDIPFNVPKQEPKKEAKTGSFFSDVKKPEEDATGKTESLFGSAPTKPQQTTGLFADILNKK